MLVRLISCLFYNWLVSYKSYGSIQTKQLSHNPRYYHQHGFFLLFLLWIWMIQNLLYWHVNGLCETSINFLIFLHDYCCIVFDYTSVLQRPVLLHYPLAFYLFVFQSVNSAHFFYCYLLISCVYISCCYICSCSFICYGTLHKY